MRQVWLTFRHRVTHPFAYPPDVWHPALLFWALPRRIPPLRQPSHRLRILLHRRRYLPLRHRPRRPMLAPTPHLLRLPKDRKLSFADWTRSFSVQSAVKFITISQHHKILEIGLNEAWYAPYSGNCRFHGICNEALGVYLTDTDRNFRKTRNQRHPFRPTLIILSCMVGGGMRWSCCSDGGDSFSKHASALAKKNAPYVVRTWAKRHITNNTISAMATLSANSQSIISLWAQSATKYMTRSRDNYIKNSCNYGSSGEAFVFTRERAKLFVHRSIVGKATHDK